MSITAGKLVEHAKAALGSAYLWGTFGQTVTEALIAQKKAQYPSVYTEAYCAKCRKNIGKKAYDCVGLIKAALWDGKYDSATDIGADTAYSKAVAKGVLSTLPERPGVCLWCKGHIGVYIGGGYAVEARGVDYGVVQTRVKDRSWTHWLEFPCVTLDPTDDVPSNVQPQTNSGSNTGLVDKLLARGVIQEPSYWLDVLNGKVTPKPENLRILLGRLV